MNKKESLALHAQGKEAWNAWAEKMLAEREALEDTGDWMEYEDEDELTIAANVWLTAARADFSGHTFEDDAQFAGIKFPNDLVFNDAIFSCAAFFSTAMFLGFVDFGNTKFSSSAGFADATFSYGAMFNGATFSSAAIFQGTKFVRDAIFADARFLGIAGFINTKFSGDAVFNGAVFLENAAFRRVMFSRSAVFSDATFSHDVQFNGMMVSGNAHFEEARFSGNAKLEDVTFSKAAIFREAQFSGSAEFRQGTFEGATDFGGAKFEQSANFRAMEGKSVFSLAGTTFRAVPDFIQAHFTEAPRLDNIRIEPPRVTLWPPAKIKARFTGDSNLAARWRALKRLAIQGQDHEREQEFFKSELLARRWSADKPWTGVFWFGLLYEWFSDFGRSVLRPFAWWGLGVLGFAGLYLGWHPALAERGMSGFGWAARRLTAFAGAETPPLSCVAGPGDPWWSALGLSLRKALLFVGQGSREKLNQIYACLYGIHTGPDAMVEPGRLPATFSPVIPNGVDLLGMVQTVFSTAMIFLILLALRNHFRIR